jgi:hypothetical protein
VKTGRRKVKVAQFKENTNLLRDLKQLSVTAKKNREIIFLSWETRRQNSPQGMMIFIFSQHSTLCTSTEKDSPSIAISVVSSKKSNKKKKRLPPFSLACPH